MAQELLKYLLPSVLDFESTLKALYRKKQKENKIH